MTPESELPLNDEAELSLEGEGAPEGDLSNLVDTVFSDADAAHREHLVTNSFAQHEALGEFYPAVRDAMDAFVEAALAADDGEPLPSDAGDILGALEGSVAELAETRDAVCRGNTTLEGLHDELTAVYLKAIYKLKRLS